MPEKKFEIDMTPSWGFVARSILALLDCNTNINTSKIAKKHNTRQHIKSQLDDMSRVADEYVKVAKSGVLVDFSKPVKENK